MASHSTAERDQRHSLWFPLLIIYLLFNLSYAVEAEDGKSVTNIGAIIDGNSRIGKQQKAAMEIAAENFNKQSDTHKLILHFRNSDRDPFIAAFAAKKLLKEQKVRVIIGMETWQEAITVADVVRNNVSYNSDQIPVISFAAPTIAPPLIQRRWPFLIRMASDGAEQMKCIGDIVSAYNWKRVVVIYEDDGYGGSVGRLSFFSETLRNVGSRIELRIVLPRYYENDTNLEDVEDLLESLEIHNVQSRVFIVLQSSLPTVTALFQVAKKKGLVGPDSAWIITENIVSLLGPQGNYDMDGTLGIRTHYDRDTTSYVNFQKDFQSNYSAEDSSKPGIYALRAYDIIIIITQAISKLSSNANGTSLQESLAAILSRNYIGLSGKMQLKGSEVMLDSPTLRIINIVDGETDTELHFWIPEVGFSSLAKKVSDTNGGVGKVIWPGSLKHRPSKGWAMPTEKKKMKIAIPIQNSPFIIVNNSEKKIYDGFCIRLFNMVVGNLTHLYSLPYEFNEFEGSFKGLIDGVYNKTYDAVIGDITVLEERMDKVEFTQPYLESGLSMIIPDIPDEEETWMFMKPFTKNMSVVTGAILIYTTFIVWFLEMPLNREELSGSFKSQIAYATWFTFSSLFFAHRDKVNNNLTRIAFIVWLFVVFILSSSYTANLSSMLTMQRLSPNVTDIDMLRSTNSLVGCDSGSFVRNYLLTVLNFSNETIKTINSSYDPEEIKQKNLSAVFLELPYAQVFMSNHCKSFTRTDPNYGFGGFSFVFQRGSPIARDFSKVILDLLENGEMRKLQDHWLSSTKCPTNTTSDMPESLSLNGFWGLFVISGVVSTFCFLIGLTTWLKKLYYQEAPANV